MNARRILLLCAVLLGMTAMAAAVAPSPETTEGDRPGARSALPAGEEVRATLSEPRGRPRRVRVRVGDTVRLTVEVTSAGFVTIDGLDVIAAVDPDAPTEVEVLADRAGTFAIALSDRGRRLGTLEVAER